MDLENTNADIQFYVSHPRNDKDSCRPALTISPTMDFQRDVLNHPVKIPPKYRKLP